MLDISVKVENFTISDTMSHKGEILLSYTIKYPQFSSMAFARQLFEINLYYKTKALTFEKFCRRKLFCLALEQYEYSIKNGFPINQYEAVVNYDVTYNENCSISLYFDQYIYSGGAHGTTVRYSNTWNLQTGRLISLSQLFVRQLDYKNYIIKNIIEQISVQIENGENYYFDNYEENVKETFKEDNFYLTKLGVIIYFQQYDIAPYSSGILEFLIPYSNKMLIRPRCK